MKQQNDVSTVHRRSKILSMLDENDQVQVEELSKLFKVSSVTIRNDLTHLENKNLLFRTRGGAIKHRKVALDLALSAKARKNLEQKQKIGAKAVDLIQEGDTIILDSGTTTLEIAKRLDKFQELTVITNALHIGIEVAGIPQINLIMPGGICRSKSFSLIGSQTERNLRDFYCDKVFLGVDGFDSTYGITTPSASEAFVNRVMMEISCESVVVTDASKFGKRSLAFISPLNKIQKVITDSSISEQDKQNILSQNIELVIV